MKKLSIYTLSVLLSLAGWSQVIQGASTVNTGETDYYYITGSFTNPTWNLSIGAATIIAENTGQGCFQGDACITVQWTGSGSHSITFLDNGVTVDTKNITIINPNPSTISGNEFPKRDSTVTYTFDDGVTHIKSGWSAQGGTLISKSVSGTEYSASIKWDDAGETSLLFKSFLTVVDSMTINVVPNDPSVLISDSSSCGETVIIKSGTPHTSVSYFWQTTSSGTSISLGSQDTLTRNASGPVYLRAVSTSTPQVWSDQSQIINYTFNDPAPPASVTNATRDGAGEITLSVDSIAGNDSFLWYTQSTGGTGISGQTTSNYTISNQLTTQTFYVATINGSCESTTRTAVTATINPVIGFDGAHHLAMGENVQLVAPIGYDTYEWLDPVYVVGTAPNYEATQPMSVKLRVTLGALTEESDVVDIDYALLNQNMNYVLSNKLRIPISGVASINILSVEEMSQSIVYTDELGRPIQTVLTMGSPTKNDMVTNIAYDQYGRSHKEYLSYSYEAPGPGAYDASWSSHQTDAYTNMGYTDTNLWAEKVFDASPLNRVTKQGSAGDSWDIIGTNTRDLTYALNTTEDKVRFWEIDETATPALSSPREYSANELYKNGMNDEDDNQVLEFVNQQGQIILKKVQVDAATWAETYYVYDIYGNLAVVIPPEGTKAFENLSNPWQPGVVELDQILENWCFQYTYDNRNQMIKKKVPGAEEVIMVYDKWDRLVLTQDGEQRDESPQKWLFTKYDVLNRPIMTGMVDHTATLKSDVEDGTDRFDDYVGDVTGNRFGYDNTSLPIIAEADVFTVTYYDTYDFKTDLTWDSSFNYSTDGLSEQEGTQTYTQPTAENEKVKGRVTGSLTRNLGDNSMIHTATYYDNKYRVIQTTSTNVRGGADRVSNLYDFIGEVLKSKTTHYDSPSDVTPNIIEDDFEYDHGGRVLSTTTTIDGNSSTTTNSYNELSQLENKVLGANVQDVSYGYNIRGWLIDINDGTSFDSPTDIFGMTLEYTGVNGYYNGNIWKMSWKNLGGTTNQNPQTYTYKYDKLNRLTYADYSSAGLGNDFRVLGFNEDGTNNGIQYDLNGNILRMKRKLNGTMVDRLVYSYANGGNQLTGVWDNKTSDLFDDNGTGSGNVDYTYDANGNMKKDENKGITSITYNHLNLPEVVTILNGTTITYTYDAAGIKLKKTVVNGAVTEVTDYIGGFHYKDNVLEFMQTADGRYVFGTTNEFEYNLTDHLGNVRATVDESGDVVQRDDYYPFGLTFNSYTRTASTAQNYKFNGIERQPELGWDLAEFRSYDPATARWHQIDPKANEFTSPYAGFGNNPIFYTDHRGDTVDISHLSASQQETYNYVIGFLMKSELFSEYYTQLQESETTYTIKAGKGEKGKPQESGQYFNPNTNEVGLGESMGAYVVAQELFHAFQSDGEFYKDDKPKPLSTIETEGDVATIYVMGESGGLTPMYGDWSQDILYDSFDGTPSLEKIQSQGYQQMFQKAVDDRIEYYKGSGLNAPTYTAPNTGVKPKALENLIKRVTGK